MTAVDDVTKTVKEAAYVAVGFGVLGFQEAQVRRRALAKQLQDQRPELEAQLAETRNQLAGLARQVEERLEPVMVDLTQRAEPVLDEIGSRLPEQAKGVWTQVRKAARDTQEQLRVRRGRPGGTEGPADAAAEPDVTVETDAGEGPGEPNPT